jgi:hypothetical protein
MVTHIRYEQESYRDAGACILGIRRYLDEGWWLSSLEGAGHGAFIATFGFSREGLRLVEPS